MTVRRSSRQATSSVGYRTGCPAPRSSRCRGGNGSRHDERRRPMNHSALRREFSELIDVAAPVERLAGGFTFTEGPIWHPRDHYLLFSDMPADVRRRYDERDGVREVKKPSNKGNGM